MRIEQKWIQWPKEVNNLANLTRICGFLMQTKVYLFWKKLPKGSVVSAAMYMC